jgi:hypothetical protein
MKYTFETQRTYVTEVTIVANSKEEAEAWFMENEQMMLDEEMKQMNVVHEETIMRVQSEEFSLHQLQTNFVGRTTSAYEYVGELNDLVGRNAFSCSTKRVDQNPQTEWTISGKDITSEEIERLNLHLDFIID